MKIIVEIKTVYGEQKVYPVCSNAQVFADIAGTKTLTEYTLNKIKALGYSIEVQQVEWKVAGL